MIEWKDLTDDRYEVSTDGEIRNKKTGRILKQSPSKQGYARVSLSNGAGNTPTIVFPHREVGLAFIPNPDNKPQINHKNANKMDPKKDNLEWVTPKENTEHAINNGLYDPKVNSIKATAASLKVISKPVTIEDTINGTKVTYPSISECSRKTNINQKTIRQKITDGTFYRELKFSKKDQGRSYNGCTDNS